MIPVFRYPPTDDIIPSMDKWSITRLQSYEECPRRVKYKYVDRIPEPDPDPDSALVRGRRLHELSEQYIKGEVLELAPELAKHYKHEYEIIRNMYNAGIVKCEEKCGVDKDWNYVEGWDDAWLLLAMDMELILESGGLGLVIDVKTGNPNYGHNKYKDQVSEYALVSMIKNPTVKKVGTELWFVDWPKTKMRKKTFVRKDMPELIADFNSRVEVMLTDTEFKAKPGKWACRFCPYAPGKPGEAGNTCDVGLEIK